MDTCDRIIDYLERNRVSTTEVADALGKTGVLMDIMPVNQGHYRAGKIKWVYAYDESNWSVHKEITDIGEGNVIFIECFNCGTRAIMGELVSKYLLLYRRSKAIVVQGRMRDAAGLIRENWPIWCNGYNPVGCFNKKPEKELDPAVISQHSERYEGSIAVCDDCGVVVIPKESITEDFLLKLHHMEDQEDIWFDRLDHYKENTFEIVCEKKYLQDKAYMSLRNLNGDVNRRKKTIILLGGNKLHSGFEDVKKRLGMDTVIVIDWNEHPDYRGDRHIQMDIKDYDKIEKLDIDWDDVAFVYTSADLAVGTQIRLHSSMGYCRPESEAVNNTLIKGRSRDCWEKAGLLNKYSVLISDYMEFEDNGADKYIFKPNCSSGSRGITVLRRDELNLTNLKNAVSRAIGASWDEYCIAEEFVEGVEYTVEMLGDSFGNVAVYGISKKYHTPYNIGNRIATKLHYAPGDVGRATLERIGEFGVKCYRAIGLKSSFGHLEVIMKKNGQIVPVEIAARSTGYVATHLLDLINDGSYLTDYMNVLQGGQVENGLTFNGEKSSMYYFYDIRPGTSVRKTNIMEFMPKGITSCAFDRDGLCPNRNFTMIDADHERYGYEILAGDSDALRIDTVMEAEEKFNEAFIGQALHAKGNKEGAHDDGVF